MTSIFITGASGWIGSAVTDELLANGYSVTGLARSDASAAALEAKGATVHRGSLDDPETLAAAVDRLLRHTHVITTGGTSRRLPEAIAGRRVVALA